MATFLLGICTGIWLMVLAEWFDNRKGGLKDENNNINQF